MSIWQPYKKRTEINMRQELINSLDGVFPEIKKAQKVLLRKMRRDDNDNLVKCSCVDETTREPDKTNFCKLCYGEGNLWDETYIDVIYKHPESDVTQSESEHFNAIGLQNVPLMIFYTRYSALLTSDDKIVELVLNNEGEIVYPPRRRNIFRIVRAIDYRLENGRLEFWKLYCFQENVRFLNGLTE